MTLNTMTKQTRRFFSSNVENDVLGADGDADVDVDVDVDHCLSELECGLAWAFP